MEQGLLQALRKYAPAGQKVDQLENFVTEAFAWLLNSNSDFSTFYLSRLFEDKSLLDFKGQERSSNVQWITQYQVSRFENEVEFLLEILLKEVAFWKLRDKIQKDRSSL